MTAIAPTRMLVLLGAAAVALAAFFFAVRPVLLKDSGSPSAAAVPTTRPATPARTPARPAAKPGTKPAIRLLPGLPANVARALRREPVVVAAVWAPRTGDAQALAQARAGAREVGAGFVVLSVLAERQAKVVEKLVGPISDPSVLVFKRPGRIVLRFDGFADAAVVAQAAHNAGAR